MPKIGKDFEPTDEERDAVVQATRGGVSQAQLCALMGISLATLKRHFRLEIANRHNLEFKLAPSEADRERAEQGAGFGMSDEEIGAMLGLDLTVLRRSLAKELAAGRSRMTFSVGAKVAKQALDGCRKSQQMMLTRIGGWKQPLAELNVFMAGAANKDMDEISQEERDMLIADFVGGDNRPALIDHSDAA